MAPRTSRAQRDKAKWQDKKRAEKLPKVRDRLDWDARPRAEQQNHCQPAVEQQRKSCPQPEQLSSGSAARVVIQ
jgi:hypothetical protein